MDRYAILDTPPEQEFDDLTRMVADLLGAPIAAVNLIAERRQWFKAEIGLGVREMPLDDSICSRMMLERGELVIPDLLLDSRFACNPLVTSGPGLRFYAGELLETPEGMPLGTLCVLDTRPRPEGLTVGQRFALRTLARQVMSQLNLRRSLAEQAQSETLRRQVLNSAVDFAIISMGLGREITGWNIGATNILGWTEAEMLGRLGDLIFTPEDQAAGVPELETQRAAGEDRAADDRWHQRKDGSRFWASGEMMALRDEGGAQTGYLKMLRDRTEQHHAGEALAAVNERFRLAQRATRDAIWDWNFGDKRVLWNEALEEAYGWSPAQVAAEVGWWTAQIHPVDRDRIERSLRAVIEGTETIWTGEYRFRRADGSYAEVLDRGYVIRGADGQAVRMIGAMLDITDRKRAEQALRESEALARENIERVQLALAAGAIIGIWNWDLVSDRLTVDEAFVHAFGLDPALGRIGLSLEQVLATVHPDDKPALSAAIGKAIARGGAYAQQYRVRRADGKYYWIEANGRVQQAPDGTPLNFPGVLIDVEKRRAVEAERDRVAAELRALNETLEQRVAERTADLLRAEEQLRQSQKMEAVGQLTGGLAHDFNNLLTGVIGSLELMKTRIAQGRIKDVDRYVEAAQGAANRAAALTHRLLAFSRRQTLDPKPTDVNRLVSGMEEMVRRTAGPAIAVETVGPADLWATLVDPGQLENALLNLCINARDAMPDGGRITVEAANQRLDRRAARVRDMEPGEYVSLCVTDNGTGMTPEVAAKALDPFFTTKPIGQGTGLGLSMIYGFAKQSGGQVRIHSEVGKGTTVCLYLPRHLGAAEAPEPASELADAPRAETGQAVLVVDDEPTVRMLVKEVLEDLGYTAIEAADGAAGLKVLRSDVRVDLLVTDVGLPGGMNGRQLADAARVVRPSLMVLFITGYAENAVVSHGHLDPGMHVLPKPFAMEALASRIKALISG